MADKQESGYQNGWDNLKAELDLARAFLPLWWRDDDAIAETPALKRLIGYDAPITLAVIPAALAAPFSLPSNIRVAQHGYDHRNRAAAGEKKSEFPKARSEEEVIHVLSLGHRHLAGCFGEQFLPLFVPPWNRFERPAALWQKAGLKKISAYESYLSNKQPDQPRAAPHGSRLDTHLDLIDWKSRAFIGEEIILAGLCGHLRAKRQGLIPPTMPTGFLSHHLVHDQATWSFLDKWTNFLENAKDQIGWISIEVD